MKVTVWCAFGRVCGRVGSVVYEEVRELGCGARGDMSNSGVKCLVAEFVEAK